MTTEARRVQAYEATLVPLTADRIGRMHELVLAVGWAHRAEDLEHLLSQGEGVLAIDAIGRAIGSAMWFRMGEDLASIGMVMTVPPLQSSGVGRWMTGEALAAVSDRKIRTVATRAAYHLDYALGFRPVATITRYHGHLRHRADLPVAPAGVRLRATVDSDRDALIAFDAQANAGSRRRKLEAVIDQSRGFLAETSDGRLLGFGLCRNFGRGRLIGPLEALDMPIAEAILAQFLRAEPEGFLRVDLVHPEPEDPPRALASLAESCGLGRDTGYTLMTLNAPAPVIAPGNGVPAMLAMMSQSLS